MIASCAALAADSAPWAAAAVAVSGGLVGHGRACLCRRPSPRCLPMGTATATGDVSVTSHPGNSVSSNYHVDFDAVDANHDSIRRQEAMPT